MNKETSAVSVKKYFTELNNSILTFMPLSSGTFRPCFRIHGEIFYLTSNIFFSAASPLNSSFEKYNPFANPFVLNCT
jgi:hypothetical protein